jgi:formylglycine-generating enzyme required for sulfatase activity
MSVATWSRLLSVSVVLAPLASVILGSSEAPLEKKGDTGWDKRIKNSIGMTLVRIPSGKFKMGSTRAERAAILALLKKEKEEPAEWLKAEAPRHDVEITKEFWLAIYEVTQRQFEDVMGYNPSHFSRNGKGKPGVTYYDHSQPGGGKSKVPEDTDNFPVENVSWEEATEFCKKLTSRSGEHGRKYRLPTEAEWEYACRGGAPTYQAYHFGNSISSKQANFNLKYPLSEADMDDYLERPCKVGSYEKNRFGLYDMHGNVWEWCADWFDKDYYGRSPAKDPPGPPRGADRVVRGGSWRFHNLLCRSAHRSKHSPTYRSRYLGFRVVLIPSGR